MGRSFDPNKHKSDPSKGEGSYLTSAGEYLVVCKSFKRETSNRGKEYLLCRFQVIDGPMKDRTFLERVYLNDEALWKLGRWCEAMQHEATFDLESDKATREAVCNRPCKVRVSISSGNGGRSYAGVDMFLFRTTPEEDQAMNNWVAAWEAERDAGGGGGDDYSDGGGDDPGFGDDDIPFAINTTDHGDPCLKIGPKRWPLR